MMTKDLVTHYYDGEGRPFMRDCVERAISKAADDGIAKVVIFTGSGEGPHYAAKELLSRERYRNIQLVAVTPPFGRPYKLHPNDEESPIVRAGISTTMRDELVALGVVIVGAHLPFKETYTGFERERSSEWTRVIGAYDVLGGGFAFCVQAVLVACDAGAIQSGERIVAASADTAFVATASRTESFLSPSDGMLVEHIICRPMSYGISKAHHRLLQNMWGAMPAQPQAVVASAPLALPPAAHAAAPTEPTTEPTITEPPAIVRRPVASKKTKSKRRARRTKS